MRYSYQTTMFGTGNGHYVFRYRAPDAQAEDHLGRLPPGQLTLAGMSPASPGD
jgi:hypothetical protein